MKPEYMPEYKHKQLTRCAQLRQTRVQTGRGCNIPRAILRCFTAALLVCILAACSTTPIASQTAKHAPLSATTAGATAPDSISAAPQPPHADPARESAPQDDAASESEEWPSLADSEKELKDPSTQAAAPPDASITAAQKDTLEQPQDNDKTSAAPAAQTPVQVPVKAELPPRINQYTVKDGENLYIIARHPAVYADGMLWPLIYRANRDQIKNPRQIYPGQTLSIPREISESDIEQARARARESQIFSASELK